MPESASFLVPTAKGAVDIEDLGMVLAHEHLFVWNPEYHANFPSLWDRSAGTASAAAELEEAYEHGVRTIVDMTVLGQGRDPGLIAEVAERTRVNIVLATGVYVLDGLPQIVRYRGPGEVLDGPDPLIDMMESDIRTGIAGTGIRAALVKFASEKAEPDATVLRLAAAVAEVHRRTRVPVVVHTDPVGGNALPLLEILSTHGVDPRHVALAHAGDATDRGYLFELAQSGAFIGCDRFGMQALAPDEQRVDTIAALIARGHLDQLLLSHDCASFIDHVTPEQRAAMSPGWSYSHLSTRVLPQLRAAGLDDGALATIFEDNPKRLLRGADLSVSVGAGRESVDVG
ncbi:Aryldialkylphosphatase [Candidatus Protofrankia californiensis]|uniref:Aryldialkylphosphatase n=1 Tax=Candidatus Protofrankia californiensis TaxID=1839754 RepID=A0A1C3NYS3_9ACTN|nr:Aryldialkylphosphatase [Candidatus Protofrankia californiensis]